MVSMDVFLTIVAIVCSLAGVAGCIIPIIPGPALSFAAVLCAFFCSGSGISAAQMWMWLAVTVVVSVMDYLLPAYMARWFGGTKAGTRGALVGMIVGMIFFNIPGVIFGPFFGAVAGELLHDGSDRLHALKVGFGSFLSFLVGTGVKLVVSVWMLAVVWADSYAVFKTWAASIF